MKGREDALAFVKTLEGIGEGCSPGGLCAVKPAFCYLGQFVGICFEGSYFASKERVLLAKSSLSAVGRPSLSR